MKHGTKFCRKCKQVKKDCEFRAGRRQCNKCKDNTRNKIKGNFDAALKLYQGMGKLPGVPKEIKTDLNGIRHNENNSTPII